MAQKWKKVDPERIRHLDRRRMSVATMQPQRSGGTEGQVSGIEPVWCPCNGDPVWIVIDPDEERWYACGVCGCAFEA